MGQGRQRWISLQCVTTLISRLVGGGLNLQNPRLQPSGFLKQAGSLMFLKSPGALTVFGARTFILPICDMLGNNLAVALQRTP